MEAGAYEFDGFVVDLDQRTLIRSGVRIPLQPRTFDLLAYLVTHPGMLLPKETLLDEVWRGAVVTDNSLTRSVRQLRVALQDTEDKHRYIETVPRAGYRFISNVHPIDQVHAQAVRPRKTRAARWRVVAGAVVLVVLPLVWVFRSTPNMFIANDARTIAVLPFVSLSDDHQNELFSDGVSEEILNELARYRDLKVIARTSSFLFKDTDYDIPRLAELLDAEYLLQGSLRKDGAKLRLSVQLVEHTGMQVWSQAYDRELGAIFEVQKDIASAVVGSIAPHLAPAVRDRAEPDPAAYRHYVIGREIVASRLPDLVYRAPRHLRQALKIDPDYAEALAELAVALTLGAGWVPGLQAQFDEARNAIARALELRPGLPRAHAAEGLLLSMLQPPDLAGAERALRRAIELDPNQVDARNWLSGVLAEQGELRESLAILEVAARLDPLSPHVNTNLAMKLAERGDFTTGEQHLERLLEVPRPWVMPRQELAHIYLQQGRLLEANRSAKEAVLIILEERDPSASSEGSTTRGFSNDLAQPSETYARLGMWDAAHRWHDDIERAFSDVLVAPLLRSTTMRRQGRHREMLEVYRRVIDRDRVPSRLGAENWADYGLLLALSGDHAAAIEVLTPERMSQMGHLSLSAVRATHALAWAQAQCGEGSVAAELLATQARHFQVMLDEGFLHLGDDLMLFAENALLAGKIDVAIDRLRAAVEAGWRDYYAVAANPWWQLVREDTRFHELMVLVKADIDRQRSILEQRVADDELDQALTRLSRRWSTATN